MSQSLQYSDYDPLAKIYDEMFDLRSDRKTIQLLEKMFLQYLPENAHILDLCCGTGSFAKLLLEKGYQVTGLDGSKEMLHYACEKAPNGKFIHGDARFFRFPSKFHGVLSVGNSLNHVMNLEELKAVFKNVFETMLDNGLFGFDMSMEEYYQSDRWNKRSKGYVTDELVWVWKQNYLPEEMLGERSITVLQLEDEEWRRSDYGLNSKIYSNKDIKLLLESVGFTEVKFYDLARDLGIGNAFGENVFLCQKQAAV